MDILYSYYGCYSASEGEGTSYTAKRAAKIPYQIAAYQGWIRAEMILLNMKIS